MGKSRLVETALERAAARPLRVVWGRSEQGQEPHKTAIRVLDGTIGSSHLTADGAPRAADIAQVRSDRRHSYAEISREFVASCAERPTVIVLDDFQWIDAASAGFVDVLIDELLAALPLPPVLFLVGYRPVRPGAPADAAISRLRQLHHTRTEVLEPLDGADIFEAIEQFGYHRPSPTLQAIVQRASVGNPLRMRAALEILRRRGVPADIQAGGRRAQGTLDVRGAADDPIREWIDGLTPATQRVLGACAITGNEFTTIEAISASAIDLAAVDTAVDEASAAGVIESDGM